LVLLTWPAALAAQRFPLAGSSLALLSILLTGLATNVDATPPSSPQVSNPLLEIYLPALAKADYGYNLGKLLGLSDLLSMLLFVSVMGVLAHRLFKIARALA